MRIKELLALIEEFAPLSLQEDYDNAGLICGDPEQEVTSVLLTTDITEAVVDEAIAGRHDLIVSHHPLTLQGLKHLRPETYIQRCLIKAIRQGIGIYSAHTNMDAARQGVSDRMADKLQLVRRQTSANCPKQRTPKHSSGASKPFSNARQSATRRSACPLSSGWHSAEAQAHSSPTQQLPKAQTFTSPQTSNTTTFSKPKTE